jgi:hypothetical protein
LVEGGGWRFDGGEWVLRGIVRVWLFCVQGCAGVGEGFPFSVLCTSEVFQRHARLQRLVAGLQRTAPQKLFADHSRSSCLQGVFHSCRTRLHAVRFAIDTDRLRRSPRARERGTISSK